MRISGEPPALPPPARYRFPLRESHRESPSAMTFRFSTEGSGFRFRSNQAVRLYLPGVEDPWGAARTFSLSSSPSEEGRIAVTCRITETPFKQALSRLAPGATAEVYGPIGAFVLNPHRPAVMIAGGIGITPFRGMLRFRHDTGIDQPAVLLYSARTPEELVFRSELDRLAVESPRFRVHYRITRPTESTEAWTGPVGRIDAALVRSAVQGLTDPVYYLAGLPEMVAETVRFLREELAVPESALDYELFRGF